VVLRLIPIKKMKHQVSFFSNEYIAISNAKRLLLDIHHSIGNDYLQSYLDEYCYKFNRRYFDSIFDRVIITSVSYQWKKKVQTIR